MKTFSHELRAIINFPMEINSGGAEWHCSDWSVGIVRPRAVLRPTPAPSSLYIMPTVPVKRYLRRVSFGTYSEYVTRWHAYKSYITFQLTV